MMDFVVQLGTLVFVGTLFAAMAVAIWRSLVG